MPRDTTCRNYTPNAIFFKGPTKESDQASLRSPVTLDLCAGSCGCGSERKDELAAVPRHSFNRGEAVPARGSMAPALQRQGCKAKDHIHDGLPLRPTQ
jgi:hypothetical protein